MPANPVHIGERSTLASSHTRSQNSSASVPPAKGVVRSSSASDCLQDEAAISDQQSDDESAVRGDETADISFESHLDNSFLYKSRPSKADPPMVENLELAPGQICSQITQTATPESGRYGDAVVIDTALLTKPELLPSIENVTPADTAISSPCPGANSVRSAQDIEELPRKARNAQKLIGQDVCTGCLNAERTYTPDVSDRLTSPRVEKDNEGQTSHGPTAGPGDSELSTSMVPDDTMSPPRDGQHQVAPGQDGAPATTHLPFIAESSGLHPFIIPELALASPLNLLSSPAVPRNIQLQKTFDVPASVQTNLSAKSPMVDSITNVEQCDSGKPVPERITTYIPPITPERNLSDQVAIGERSLEQLAAEAVCATAGEPMSLDEHDSADAPMVSQKSEIVGCTLAGNKVAAGVINIAEAKDSHGKQASVTMLATNDDKDAYEDLATGYRGAKDKGEIISIQTEGTAIEVTSSPIQPSRYLEDKLKMPVIKIEPVQSKENITAALQESALSEDILGIELNTRDIKAEPEADATWASCSGHISIPSSPVVQSLSSEMRLSQQSPWMEAIDAPTFTVNQTPLKLGLNSSVRSSSIDPRTSEKEQSPWVDDNLRGGWLPHRCLTSTPFRQGAPHNASQTEGMQMPVMGQSSLARHPFTPVVSQRASTPDLGFSIKSFANFNTPSPKWKPSGVGYSRVSRGKLPSALKHVGSASSDAWRNAQPRSSQTSSARRVTFAPLPGADVETETGSLRHPSTLRPASPPPLALTSIEPGEEDEDGRFQKHFEVMRRRSGDTPKFRLTPRLLPNSSQQGSASPAVSAMAEAFRDATALENIGEESTIADATHASSIGDHFSTAEEVESTPQLPMHCTGENHNMANAPQHPWQSEDQIETGDDVADVLRNLDDFLNPRWETNDEAEKAVRADTGKENQQTRFEGAEVDLWGMSVWDVPRDPEGGTEAFMTWN